MDAKSCERVGSVESYASPEVHKALALQPGPAFWLVKRSTTLPHIHLTCFQKLTVSLAFAVYYGLIAHNRDLNTEGCNFI